MKEEVFWEKLLCEGIFQFFNGLSTVELAITFLSLSIIIIFISYFGFKAYIIQKDASSKEEAVNVFIKQIAEKENKIQKLEKKIQRLESITSN